MVSALRHLLLAVLFCFGKSLPTPVLPQGAKMWSYWKHKCFSFFTCEYRNRSLSELSVWNITLYSELLPEWWSCFPCFLKRSGSLWVVTPIFRFDAYNAVYNGFEVYNDIILLVRKLADFTKCFLCTENHSGLLWSRGREELEKIL